jgi:hypothetical protein
MYDVKRLKNDTPYNLQVGAAEFAGLMQDMLELIRVDAP